MSPLDERDRRLLDRLQQGLPLCPRPYQAIAADLGDFSEDEVIRRTEALKARGLIRRMAAFFQSDALGYRSTLCAMKVPDENIDAISAVLNTIPGVTHNYLRDHPFNMWFTLIARNEDTLSRTLADIQRTGLVKRLIRLDRTRRYKVCAVFHMGGMTR